MSSKFHGLWINSLKQGNQTIASFKTEIHGAGCGLDRVWIGLDPGLDRPRPRIEPTFLRMLQLGCSVQQVDSLAAWQPGLATVSAWQLGCATVAAWLLDSLVARQFGCLTTDAVWQLGSVANQHVQLGCLTAWLLSSVALQQVQLRSLTAWQRGFKTLCCLAAWQGE